MLSSPTATSSVSSDWSLIIESNTIWRGAKDTYPSANILSDVIPIGIPEEVLSDLTIQVLKNAPVASIPTLLNCLTCNYWRMVADNDRESLENNRIKSNQKYIDIKALQKLSATSNKSVCGYVFNQGDIVWTCRQCAKDQTSVQCDKCFRRSDHEGHEVYFHKASGGGSGCCDCGDADAWARLGNCLDHSHQSRKGDLHNHNSLDEIEIVLQKGLRAVLKGLLGLIVSHTVCSVHGFQPKDENTFMNSSVEEVLSARVHNDDIHSVDQVVKALENFGCSFTQAKTLTTKIDKDGEAVIYSEVADSPKMSECFNKILTDAKLFLSVVPEQIMQFEIRISCALSWLQTIGMMHDGFRQIVSEELLIDLNLLPPQATALKTDTTLLFGPRNVFDNANQFPSVIQHTMEPPLPMIELSKPTFYNSSDDPGEELMEHMRHPFDVCHRNPFAILIIASPYLAKTTKKHINDIIIKFQHDSVFKMGFSQLITVLYPPLFALFGRGIGTSDNTIFHTTVQVYTANSVVALMSSDGVNSRYLAESKHIMITKMLMSTFIAILRLVNCETTDNSGSMLFLQHPTIRTNRLFHLCRDLEYVTNDANFALRLIASDVDRGTIDDWITICTMLQGIDRQQRRATTHIEHEDNSWQSAANLVLEVESVSAVFVSIGLIGYKYLTADTGKNGYTSHHTTHDEFDYSKVTSYTSNHNIQELQTQAVEDCVTKTLHQISSWASRDHILLTMFDSKSNSTEECMEFTLEFPSAAHKSYAVSKSFVSMHIPLHRFIAKIITYAAHGNVVLTEPLTSIQDDFSGLTYRQFFDFADYPLRCLVFAAQVSSNMWRRNGNTAMNLAYNYNRAPLSKFLKDMDIVSCQLSVILLGPDNFLALALHRFEVLQLLNNFESYYTSEFSDNLKEYKSALLSEFLRTLIHILVYTPISLIESTVDPLRPTEGYRKAITREVVHHIIGGSNTTSQLHNAKAMIGNGKNVSDELFHSVINEICIKKEDEDGEGGTLALKPDYYKLYDPEYPNQTTQHVQTGIDRMKTRLKSSIEENKQAKINSAMIATGSNASNNDSNSDLNRNFIPLLTPLSLPKPHAEFNIVRSMLYRPMFFRLLQRSLSICLNENFESGPGKLAIIERCIHLVLLQIVCISTVSSEGTGSTISEKRYEDSDNWTSSDGYFAKAFTESIDEENSEIGYGRGLLEVLAEIWALGITKDNIIYHESLGWILKEIASNSPDGSALLNRKGISFDKQQAEELEKAARKKKQLEAQKRAMSNIGKNAKAFAMIADLSDDEDEELQDSNSLLIKDSELQCIVCREKNDKAIGFLCFLQPSNVIKNTMIENMDCDLLKKVLRVVSIDGCDVHSSRTQKSPVIYHLMQGEHILMTERTGKWVKIQSPVVGWCRQYSMKIRVDAQVTAGANRSNQTPLVLAPRLHPVSDMMFNKHGGTRIHVSKCGHAMHYDCWDTFTAASIAKHGQDDEHLAFSIKSGEALCPLCKGITNAIIPSVNSAKTDETQSDPCNSSLLSNNDADFSKIFKNIGNILIKKSKADNTNDVYGVRLLHNLLDYNVKLTLPTQLSVPLGIYSLWSATAYTLLSASVKHIRERELNSNHSATENSDVTLHNHLRLSEQDYSTVYELLRMMRHAQPLWFEETDQYNTHLIKPFLSTLCAGYDLENGSKMIDTLLMLKETPLHDSEWKLVDIKECSDEKFSRICLTMSYHTVSNCLYPNKKILTELIRESVKRSGKNEKKVTFDENEFGFFNTPLLLHDFSVMVIGASSLTSSFHEFLQVTGVLCLAKLTQILMEATSNGMDRNNHTDKTTSHNNHEKMDSSSDLLNVSELIIGDRKRTKLHDERDRDHDLHRDLNTQSTSLKTDEIESIEMNVDQNNVGNGIIGSVAQALSSIRSSALHIAQIPSLNNSNSPTGEKLVGIVLDSWIPFLEFVYQVRHVMYSIYRPTEKDMLKPADVNVSLPSSITAIGGLQIDYSDAYLTSRLAYCGLLQDIIGISSFEQIASSANHMMLVQLWSKHVALFYDLAASSGNHNTSNSSNSAVLPWIPTETIDISQIKSPMRRMPSQSRKSKSSFNLNSGGLLSREPSIMNEDEDDEPENLLSQESIVALPGVDEGNTTPTPATPNTDNRRQGINMNFINDVFGGGDGGDEDGNEMDWMSLDGMDGETGFQGLNMEIVAGLLAAANGDQPNLDELLQIVASNLRNEGSDGVVRKEKNAWPLYGVDPCHPLLDEVPAGLMDYATRKKFDPIFDMAGNPLMLPTAGLVGSLTGCRPILGLNGQVSPFACPDLSHFNIGLRHMNKCFVQLPSLYTDLYQMAKFPDGSNGKLVDDPAICLVCGKVLNAGKKMRKGPESFENAGECTLHSRRCGDGIGIFFLLQQCTVLLMRGSRSCYFPSIYLDALGEVPENRGQNKPLYLSNKRYRKLEELYLSHAIAREVSRKRSTEERIIRMNWY
eukprot:gene10895-14625_t